MKKITLFLATALATLSMNAQNTYTLTTLTGQTYTELDGATSINNGEIWDWDYYGEFTMPIDFSFEGQTVTRFLFEDDYFAFLTPTADYDSEDNLEGIFVVYPTGIYIQDRTYSTGNSSSPISYTVEGTAPNRIMKLQLKNVGAEDAEWYDYDEDTFYMNFQVWLYESDKAVEIHYGPSNITDEFLSLAAEDDFTSVVLFDADTAFVAYGDPNNATYAEYSESNYPANGPNFNTYPANGTVYRFGPTGTTGTQTFKANTFNLYPNPAATVLNVTSNNVEMQEYAIYNVMGAKVAANTLNGTEATIDVQNLQSGVYVIEIDGQHMKFVKN